MNGNTITVSGRCTRNPADDLKVTPGGRSVVRFGVASDYRYQKDGEWQGEPSFFDVECWGDLADNIADSLSKGDAVTVVGRMQQRSYEKDGQKRTVWELKADDVSVSLRWATAAITRTERSSNGAAAPMSI